MKKTTVFFGLIFLCTLSFSSRAQAIVKMGTGYSFGRSAEIETAVGYNWPFVSITGGIQVQTSASIKTGVVFELKAGHDIPLGNDWGLVPAFGYGYQYNTSDFKNLNIGRTILSIELYKMIRDDIGIYGAYTNTGRLHIISIGVRGYIFND